MEKTHHTQFHYNMVRAKQYYGSTRSEGHIAQPEGLEKASEGDSA